MKEDLKTILYMGLGAVSESTDAMKNLSNSLYEKGKELYEKGVIKNEELKHNINELMKEKDGHKCNCNSTDDIVRKLNSLSEKEKKEIMSKMGWADVEHEQGANR